MSAPSVAEALERARVFTAKRGDALARLSLDALLGVAPLEAVEEALRPLQAPDGAFAPPRQDERGPPDLAGTLEVVGLLDHLRRLDGPEVERAVAYLVARQRSDGCWSATPGEGPAARLVLTGVVGGYLAKTPFAPPRVLEAAGGFLGARWAPERVQGGDYGALVAFAHFFSNAPHELSDAVLQWCGRELERGYRSQRLDPLRAARVFTLCDAQALPGARVTAGELVPALLAGQGADGGWSAACAAASPWRIAATLEAALALVRAERGPGRR